MVCLGLQIQSFQMEPPLGIPVRTHCGDGQLKSNISLSQIILVPEIQTEP